MARDEFSYRSIMVLRDKSLAVSKKVLKLEYTQKNALVA